MIFSIDIRITPHVDSNCYSVEGTVKSALDLICSRCAIDFKFPVNSKINDILLVKDEANRNEHYVSGGQINSADLDGPFCTLLSSNNFNLSEFIHEIIALAEPYRATAKENCDDSCAHYQMALSKGWLKTNSQSSDLEKDKPFDILKEIKLNTIN